MFQDKPDIATDQAFELRLLSVLEQTTVQGLHMLRVVVPAAVLAAPLASEEDIRLEMREEHHRHHLALGLLRAWLRAVS